MTDTMGGARAQGVVRDDRRQLSERLRERAAEIEEAIVDRICALERSATDRPHQLRGVKRVVQSTLQHGIDSIELGERYAPPPPPVAIDHARKAAWRSVSIQTLYDHYFAGYAVFKHFLLRESISVEVIQQAQGSLDVVFQRLIRAIGEEHQQELQKRCRSSDVRRLERVQELLSGDLLEAPDLRYPLDVTHVGVVASGPEASSAIRHLRRTLVSQLLVVNPEPNRIWTWIAVRKDLTSKEVSEYLPADLPSEVCISIGEPAEGLAGWRLTHRQALAAHPVALRKGTSMVRFSDVALIATALESEVLRKSLTRQYLEPLNQGRGGGMALRETLRAYFIADHHISSAACLLDVKRHTVSNRLERVEELLGCRVSSCTAELELALRLEELV